MHIIDKKITYRPFIFVKTGVLSLVKDGAIMVGTEVEKRIGEDRMKIVEEIKKWKQKKNAVILAHYYVNPEIQEIADYIGDSFYLSKVAVGLKEQTIVFCGVSFMGESAKILNPKKTVLMPDLTADCAMAHMADAETIQKMREKYEDLAVVCYINSTAELKRHSDVCVTSANAVQIVKALPNKRIFFIPDKNLARYVAEQVPEKEFVFNNGYCPVHEHMQLEEIKKVKEQHPQAELLTHPELLHMRQKALAKSLLSAQKMGCAMNWRSRIQIRNFILQRRNRFVRI